jgi:integrase/recombinase XerD
MRHKKSLYPLTSLFLCHAHLPERGLSLRHIQAILGHSSPMPTARYTHLTDITEKDSLTNINTLINTLHVDLSLFVRAQQFSFTGEIFFDESNT